MSAPYTPPPVYAGKWTDKLDDEVRRLQSKGFSFQDFATRLRCSRNSVIGRARRIGLSSHVARVWTPAEDDALRELADAKRTRIQAAKELGCSFYAVAARAKKLGIRFSQSNRGSHGPRKTTFYVSAPAPTVQEPPPAALGLTIMQLEHHHCRYPYGGRENYTFCGAQKAEGSSFCVFHKAIVYIPYDRDRQHLRRALKGVGA